MLLDGVHVPLLTPFYPDGRVYLRKLEANVRRYSLTPVSGLIVLGAGSEAASLNDAEQIAVLRAVAETAAPEKVLLATLNHAGCVPALELAEEAARLECDGLVLQPPATLAADEAAIRTWFRVLLDRAPLPCVLGAQCAGASLPVELLADLSSHPRVRGILEASTHISRVAALHAATADLQHEVMTTITFTAATRRMLRPAPPAEARVGAGFVSTASLTGDAPAAVMAPTAPSLRTRTKRVTTQILWAHATDSTEALRAGATGIATSVAAAVPQAVFEIWAAWKDGDTHLMHEKQGRVALVEPMLLQAGAPLLKTGAERSGYFGGRPRLPLLVPTAAAEDELVHLLDGMRS